MVYGSVIWSAISDLSIRLSAPIEMYSEHLLTTDTVIIDQWSC